MGMLDRWPFEAVANHTSFSMRTSCNIENLQMPYPLHGNAFLTLESAIVRCLGLYLNHRRHFHRLSRSGPCYLRKQWPEIACRRLRREQIGL